MLCAEAECNGDAERGDCRKLEERHEDARGSPEVLVAADLVILAEAVQCDEEARNYRANGFQAG